jgi:hypothetical protein
MHSAKMSAVVSPIDWGDGHAKIFTEIRYHHAGYNHVSRIFFH